MSLELMLAPRLINSLVMTASPLLMATNKGEAPSGCTQIVDIKGSQK